MIFKNSTHLNRQKLLIQFLEAANPYPIDDLTINVRYSRGADFSGTCYYATGRLFVNLGRHLEYPYTMATYIARTISNEKSWTKPLYTITLADGYQLALFIMLHELYHWLVKRAGRNTRQKESMCDRFAARHLHDHHGCPIRTPEGRLANREDWDFQNLDAFIVRARQTTRKPIQSIPAITKQASAAISANSGSSTQFTLFES